MALGESVVVAAAVRRATRSGVDTVGMRSVAADLGVTPMALYRHVGDAQALRCAVIDEILRDLPVVTGDGAWDQRCRAWAHEARDVIARVPGLAHHVLLHWIDLPAVLASLESLVGTMERDAPIGVDAVAGANALLTYVLMRAQAEERVRGQGQERDLSTLRSRREELPHLWKHRQEYQRARLDEHFAYGLDALLAGIATTQRRP